MVGEQHAEHGSHRHKLGLGHSNHSGMLVILEAEVHIFHLWSYQGVVTECVLNTLELYMKYSQRIHKVYQQVWFFCTFSLGFQEFVGVCAHVERLDFILG